jgi:hypothetical protein
VRLEPALERLFCLAWQVVAVVGEGLAAWRLLPAPTRTDVTEVARRTACRIERILRAHGRSMGPQMQDDESHAFLLDRPGLAACYAASAQGVAVTGERKGQPTLRLVVSQSTTGPTLGKDPRDADLDNCPRCGGPMRWLEVALTQDAVARLLANHGLAPRPPPTPPRPSPGQLKLPFPHNARS